MTVLGNVFMVVRFRISAAVPFVPVEALRIIKPQPDTVFSARLGELGYNILPKGRSVDRIVRVDLRLKK